MIRPRQQRVRRLDAAAKFSLSPVAPFDFEHTMVKPVAPNNPTWRHAPGRYWQTLRWDGDVFGIAMQNAGTRWAPQVDVTIFSSSELGADALEQVAAELRWRFDLDLDMSWFCRHFADDEALAGPIDRLAGMRISNPFSLYEYACVLTLNQQTTIGRTMRMFMALLDNYGQRVRFDDQELQAFWQPKDLVKAGEQALRQLRLGYRARSLVRISHDAASGALDDIDRLRAMDRDQLRKALLKLHGIGPASVSYFEFHQFHHYDAFDVLPPWETKIFSRILYDLPDASADKILADLRDRYGRWRATAADYLIEDLILRHQHQSIDWLAAEIRL